MSSNQGYIVKQYSMPIKRYCQTLSLKNIAEYRKVHSKSEAWPEIRKGIRSIGILEMEMYILGSQVFMIIETPINFDWETAMNKLAHLPKQEEWENYVSRFQECVPGSTSAEKWKLMERMFYLYE